MRFCFEVHIFSLLIQTADRSDEDSKEPQAHLGDGRHQPHGLLGVGQEDFGHDGHEDVEDLVAGVAHPGDELREGGEELVRRQVVAVLNHHRVDLAQLLPHLSVRTPRWWLHSDTESESCEDTGKTHLIPFSLTFLMLAHSGSEIQPQ